MNGSFHHEQARRSPAAFLLWGWTMLLVVLLSAAPTGGQPRTRLLGSAFDPATVSVVLSPKQSRVNGSLSSLHRRRVPERMGGGSAHIASLAQRAALSLSAQAGRQRFEYRDRPIAGPRPFARAHRPRAPPLA